MSVTKNLDDLFSVIKAQLESPVEDGVDLTRVTAAKLSKPVKQKNKKDGDWKLAVLLPDAQIGFRKFNDGELDPFHDTKAIDVALQITAVLEEEYGVDDIINLGDTLDLPNFGKYMQEESMQNSVNESLRAGHAFLQVKEQLLHTQELFT